MGRWAIRLTVLVFVASSGYAIGQTAIQYRAPARSVAVGQSRPAIVALTALVDRPHPRGLDADDSSRWSPKWGTEWKGGGRHPVWRGCRRFYDPQMNAFLNTPASVDMTSGT
jgi:hypothetical protein